MNKVKQALEELDKIVKERSSYRTDERNMRLKVSDLRRILTVMLMEVGDE